MKKFKFKIRGNEYGVHIQSIDDNIAKIEVNGTSYEVELENEAKQTKTPTLIRKVVQTGAQKIEKKEGGSSTPVKAPLPGKIILVKAKIGDQVKKGDVLLIMEAMKMENEVMASKDGVIETIKVNVGDSVLEGDVLMETV
ncbi:MAG: biotin/lipoyl-binding protein [Bacteroidales bacterium]|nr:biotin/lipoyl-binding protein [Bacteroidales bacterium]MBN2820066.1 biotin/lipoyl-binding protein [Bacteroidales bacterium]